MTAGRTQAQTSDFGDHSSFGSASSTVNTTLKIGATTDKESAATTNATATGDDTTGTDDEDGVTVPAALTQGTATSLTVNVTNTSGSTAYLNVWIDFNRNGVLTDSGEQVATNTTIATSTSNSNRTVSFTTPAAASLGTAGVRVRLTSTSSPTPLGAKGNGEVEDYVTTIAPNTDYGDYPSFAAATQVANSIIRIGTNATDTEDANPATGAATADDTTGTDDEDLSMPALVAGTGTTLAIPVTVTTASLSGSTARINVFADWNGDNDVVDTNETLAVQTVAASGTFNFTLTPPAGTTAGTKYLRIRITEGSTAPVFSGTSTLKGEVEDYAVTVASSDFGDYSAFTAASSTMNSTLKLGATTDAEAGATTNATATGDDTTNTGSADDEDGVTVPASLMQGTSGSLTVNVTNTSGASAYLNAWIDFNGNGVLTDSGEQVAANTVIATGTSNTNRIVSFTVPALATAGTAGVRVRLTSTSSPGPTGASGNGEVEDHTTSILSGSSVLSRFSIISKNTISVDSSSLSTGRALANTLSLTSTTMNIGGTSSAPDAGTAPTQHSLALQTALTLTSSTIRAYSGSVYLSPSITFTSSNLQYPSGGGSTVTTSAPDFNAIYAAMNSESDGYASLPANSSVVISGSTYTLQAGAAVGAGVAVFNLAVTDINSARFVLNANGQNPRAWIVNVSGTGNATFNSTTVGSEDRWKDLLFNFHQCTGTVAINSTTMNASVLAPSATISINSTTKEGSIAGNQIIIISSTIGFPMWTGDYNGTMVAVGNLIYKDLNADGNYDSGEGIDGITVQLYEKGDTAGVTTPAATTTTAGGGRYLFSNLRPGSYFIHVPASNFSTSGLLAGLYSATGSSWRDDEDHGIDNFSPSSSGISTSSFVLTPGSQPTDTIGETGFDAASDNSADADTNLTIDMGFAALPVDFGDHSAFPSAASVVNSALRIGSMTDAETTSTLNTTATGDDTTGSDDEDGVTVPSVMILSASSSITVNVTNTTGTSAYLNAWIDFNRNGSLSDSGEQIASNTVISTGTSNTNRTITFTVPSGSSLGASALRVRLTSTSSPGPDGADGKGEIEDHAVQIGANLGIGNMVWNDANENGLFDPEESGINNVLVELWTPGADNAIGGISSNADTKVTSMNTSGGGLYNFSGLPAGYYYVKVPTPPLSRTSLVVDTTDNGQDGDNNASQPGGSSTSAYSPVIQLSAGAEPGSSGTGNIDNTVDFGFASNIGSPFVCDNRFWVIQNAETSAGSGVWDSTLYYVGDGPSLVPTFVFTSHKLNALAAYGGYLYCVDQNGNNLYRINSQGVLVDMGIIAGLPAPGSSGQWSGATALTNGRMILNLYNFSPASTVLYTIDLTSATLIGSGVTVSNSATSSTYAGNFGDIVWDPLTNKVYGYSTVDNSWLGLFEINTTTGAASRVAATTPGSWGSMIIDANGLTYGFGSAGASGAQDTLYAFNRTSGVLNGSITAVGSGPAVSNSDGAACPGAPPSMKMGNLVWNDVNNNGIKDSGEAGIDGVTLQIFLGGQDPLTAAPAATTTTAGGGLYSFNNLSPGQYFIYIPNPPVIYPLSSVTTASTDNGVDNDDNGIQSAKGLPVRSPLIGLAGGTEPVNDGDTDANTDLSIDFGLLTPTADYGDHSVFAAASQAASTSIRIGANATDAEGSTPTAANATGDDTTDTDDEDLVMPSVVSGGESSLSIPVTLSSGLTLGRIGVWADWNDDGDTLDTNEAVTLTSSSLIDGVNTLIATLSPPAGTSVGTKYLRIRVVEGTTAPGFSGESPLRGEVEDHAVAVTAPTMDYGDLPDTIIGTSAGNYQTLSNDNGPSHTANTNLRLGALVDAEGNGLPNSTASGDGGDDDGVAALPTLTQNLPATLTITATNSFGSAAFLKAWIDWNYDGNLTADEELGAQISVPNGASNGSFSFNFNVPGTAAVGSQLGLRIRLASATIPASTGPAGTGEVEDYLVTVNASTSDFGDYPNFAAASRIASTLIKVGAAATDADNSNPATGTANVDDTSGTDDEDLAMPVLTAGANATLSIGVTLTSPVTAGRIAVWADWNGDNDVSDTNEAVTLSTASLVTGTNTITATLSPPLGITGGTKYLRIIATEGTTVPSFSGSSTLKGEVEDYAVTVDANTLDFGDLPDTGTGTGSGNYQTLTSDGGASHSATATTLRLGNTVDMEANGQPNATANGDGADEDGISSMPVFYRGQNFTIPVSVLNNTEGAARIFGFIDFNNDGDFADTGETLAAVVVNSSATQQSVNITGTTPGTATLGTFGARFRLATAASLTSTGTTSSGEVEDYIVTGACPTLAITPASLPATSQYSTYNQTLSAAGGTAPYTWTITSGAIPGGITFSSAGIVNGTVISASGAYVFTVRATDASGCTASQSCTISVGSGGMSVGNLVFLDENNNGLKDSDERGIPNVPVEIWSVGADARVNTADDQPVTSGTASTLNTGGMITLGTFGTIASGFSTLTSRTDWNGAFQFTELPTGSFYLKITPPNKTVFSSKFGTGSTTYSLNLDFPLASSAAVLTDNGIDNDNNGVQTSGSFINGTDAVVAGVGAAVFSMPFALASATEPGTSNLGSDEYTLDFGLRPCPVISITPITVPAVKSGVAYSHTMSAAGGVAPHTYAITQGALPSGLSMSGTGTISGTTSTLGTSAITVRATDARGCQGFTTLQISVTSAMSISTATLPNGVEGTAYTSTTFAAAGATAPYQNWRVSTGTLPAGLSIDSSTGNLSGTPTSPGTYVFTVAVDDASVTPASVTVTNGSFETDAWSAVSFVPRSSITGWSLGNAALTGTASAVQLHGINDTSNSLYGDTAAGTQYLASPFVGSWASQTVSGFTVGRPYTLRVRYAMRGAFTHPSTTEAQPPFYGDALWIAGYNASAATLFGPVSANLPAAVSANYDNWATLDVPFIPQISSMVFSYGLDGAAIDDIQFIPTVAPTITATKQFTVVISGNRDWGDLPDTGIGTGAGNYQTLNNDSGPSHYRNTNLRLGATLDIDSDGQPSATAAGDDTTGDDEDAIGTLPAFERGMAFSIPVSVFNNTGSTARVFAFIDWNNDGDFLDPSEALSAATVNTGASQQSVNVTGSVPGNAVLTQTGLRVRLSTASTLGAFGIAVNGEVEDYLVTTTCPTIALSPASLANGMLSIAYSQTVTAAGGTAPYTFALSSGTLPSGVTLNTTSGVLSGTPNIAGTHNFTLGATDANGCSGTQAYSVVMSCPTISVTPATLTTGTVGTTYSQTLTASGGASPYGSWTVTSGTLPAGLTLNSSTGVISGTPTAGNGAGTTVTVRATDANGCQGAQAVTLKICPVITVNPATLAAATVNGAYSQTITASGGATPYTFNVSSGTLPAGLTLSSAGVLSGTPTSTISRTFSVTVTDANGCAGSRSHTLAPACPVISITPAALANGAVGVAYSQPLTASGGILPYGSWTVTSGTLPAGLALDATTGSISGTPTAGNGAGTTFTVRTTDANGCTGSQVVTLKICPVITLSPATLPNGMINTAYSQTISGAGGSAAYTFALASGTLPAGMTLNTSSGVISGTPTSTAAATFTLRATDANGCSGTASHTIIPAPDSDFGDHSAFTTASSRANSTLKLGATTDAEASATANTTATGDDTTGSDDEDGVTLPASITQGGATTITVNLTNTSGTTAYLNVWIDFNQNGSLADAGEQVAANTAIATGTSNINRAVSFTAPANATLGSAGVRVRLTSISTPGPDGADGNGEVEDNVATVVAPTTDYGDFSLFADAFSTGVSSLKLGALTDLEGSATKNATATGDDTTGSDDEDAITFPSMTAGQPMTLPVTVTNTTGATAYLNAWIDYNNNGVLTDAGEQIATNVNIVTGTSNGTINLNFTVPTNAVTAAALIGTRFRLTNVTTPGSTGGIGNGEVEDHGVTILAPLTDFGDLSTAPDISNTASTNLRLGTLVDTEYASTRNATATGDDTIGNDDEDGVTIPAMIAGAPVVIPVVVSNNTGSPGHLNAWIDYNNNGVFTDAGEQIATNTLVSTGTTNATSNISITVPPAAITGADLGVRVRITNDLSPGSTGSGGVGEVEDYIVNIAQPTTDFGDLSMIGGASSTRNAGLRIGALLDTEYVATTNATATGDDITASDDEDGVTLPALIAGGPALIPVIVTNTTASPAYLNAWIDFNGNGVLTDAGEQIATDVLVAAGTNAGTINLNITVPPAALTAVNLATRVRLADITAAAVTGAGGNGEVEDYLVNITAPTTDFGDFSGFADANQGVNPALRIGGSVDAEYSATKNATASGDDGTGGDDEDGVILPAMTAGQTVMVPVAVTNITGAPGYLNAWIDFNNNGVLTDSGEQIATNTLVATGTTDGAVNITVTVPVDAVTGVNLGTRFRFSAPSGLGPVGANGFSGEIEDHMLTIAAPVTDFGDFNGLGSASNLRNTTLRLGTLVDAEYNQTANATATGDDTTGTDDEDGVTLPSMTAGQTLSIPVMVTNTTGSGAFLNVWIDFNNNGSVTDSGEQIAVNTAVATGSNGATLNLPLSVPTNAVTGTNLGMRFRLSASSSPGATGNAAVAGEIEDYVVNIIAPTTDFGDWSGAADASNGISSGLRLGALADAEFAATKNATATGDDITGSDDEDGVTLPAMIAGQTVSIPVIVTNTLGTGSFLNAWIDYNNNGVFTDAGEQIAVNTAVATGLINSTINLSVTVPANAVTGTSLGARFRLTATASPGATGSGGGVGEVEDHVVTIAAPTTDFGDFNRFTSASSTVNANLQIGTLLDPEFAAATNATATGDDTTGSDDEDGVAFPSMTAGQTITLPVTVTNTSGAAAFLNVWFDLNNDGLLTGVGEQVAADVSIASGVTNAVQNLSVTIPITATLETDLGVRVRLTSVSSPGPATVAGNGEVEDYVVQIARPLLDYSDWTGAADAASTASSNLRLGATVDAEFAATKNATATSDDITLSDDEDGVTPGSMTAGAAATITLTTTNLTGAAAYLNLWIDFNNNGVFTDVGEQLATNTNIATGSNNTTQTINFTVPATAATGSSLGLRARLTSVSSPGATGIAGTGEVEDMVVNIAVPTTDFGDWNGAADASSTASSNLRMGALADTEYVSTRNTNANGDDTTGSDDEDGVTLSALTPATTGGLSVVVTNNSGATAYLNAWIDFNNNGVFTDAGEQIATNSSVATNTNGATRALSFAVPADAIPGQRGARFRLTSTQTPGATGHSGTGEVEDHLVTMNCPVITISPATLGGGVTGAAYSQTVSASGGRTAYVFSLASGALPAGLSLDSASGVISGTLATTTPATFTIRVTDANNCAITRSYTITPVCPTLTMTPAAMPAAVVGTAFSQTVAASGGTAPYTFALASGSLPAGLALNTSTGVISGTPTSTVPVIFAIRATDTYGCAITTTYGLNPGCAAIDIAPATLPGGFTGTAYTAALSATPATTYSWTVAAGALPPGLTLNASTGALSGTPTTTGSHSFTVRASTGAAATPELEFTTYNLDLNPGDTFNIRHYVVPKDGSTRPIDWSTVRFTYTDAGANDPTSPADWNLAAFNAGQPVTLTTGDAAAAGNSGTGAFRIYLVRDGQVSFDDHMEIRVDPGRTSVVNSAKASPLIAEACTGTRAYNINICPAITVNPTTLAQPTVSIPYNQTVSATGGTAPYVFTISSGSLPAGLTLNSVTGAVTGTPTSTTGVSFTITATDLNGCQASRAYSQTPLTAPTLDYGDYTPFTSASSTRNNTLRIGALVDAETVANTDATADGDDNDNMDDEDGVTISDTITPGMTASMVVKVTNTRGSTAYLNVWLDYNRNGSLTDSGEQIASNVTISTGTSNSNRTINFTVPAGASMGVAGARVRLTSVSSPGPGGQDGIGEVEDNTVNIAPPPTLDFSDHLSLPSASSTANTTLRLGSLVDAETYALVNSNADGDDTTGSDDEDGVTLPASLTPGVSGTLTAVVTNTSGATAFLNAWIDFNRNGVLTDEGEQIATNTTVATGTSGSSRALSFTVPVSTGAGLTPVRVRLTSVSSPGADGQDGNGEVEDHVLNVVCPTLTLSPTTLPNAAVGEAYSQTITTSGGNAPYSYVLLTGSLPAGLTLSSSGIISGTPVTTETDTFTVHVTDAAGCTAAQNYSLGVHPRPSLGNLVWNDLDNDGLKDANEPGVAGVLVELLNPGTDNAIGGTGANADTLVLSTTTDSAGAYSFNALDQGRYYIQITPPDNLPLASSVVVSTDNGVDNDNNGVQSGSNGGPIVSPVIQLIAGGETAGGSADNTLDFGLIVGNSVIWLIDEDYTLSTALHLWSFKNYRTPATTATDYGRLKYRRPSDGAIRDIADGGDIEAMAINHFTGEIYIFSSGRISGAPSNTQSLWTYNLNDANDNIGNIVLTLIGHVQMPTSGAFIEGLAYDPASKRFYMADPKDNAQNSSTTPDRLYYLDIRNLNANPMLATPLTAVGDMSGLGSTCNYVDGLEFDTEGRLYAVDGTDDHVYQINPATGAIMAITDNSISGGPGGTVDVETLAWDDVSSRLIAVDNSGQRFIEVTLNSNGSNIGIASYRTGVPGMPSSADLEASAMYDTYPPRPRVGVGNAVFIDANYNGLMDAGEGVNDVTVELYEAGDTPGVSAPAATTLTAGGGLYAFTRLLPDDYFIFIPASNFQSGAPLFRQASVAGTTTTDDHLGEDGIDDATPALNGIRSATFTLAKDSEPTNATGEAGADATSDDADDDNTDLTIDFGFQDQSMSLGSLVWSDVNNNGTRDAGELGLAAVTVQIYTSVNNIAGDADDALWSGGTNFTTTSASGLYSFTGLPPGKYVVRVNAPAGYISGGTPDTADNGEDNDNNGLQPGGVGTPLISPVITLTPNTEPVTDGDTNRNSELSIDFGLFTGLSLGNLVWNDSNNNGIKDTAELGVSGVTVELLTPGADNAIGGTGANADTVVQTTTTNASGFYGFTIYASGRYFIRLTPAVAQPVISAVSVNADNGIDNDSNGLQPGGAGTPVLSPVILLTAGGEPGSTGATNSENTLDFGLRACPALTLSPGSLAAATVGTVYSQAITASGGTAPYVLAFSSGTLPAGLSFNATTGIISGTPTGTVAGTFTLRVTDATGCSGTQSYTITPACPALSLSPSTLPAAYLGATYNQTFTASNGTAPYSYVLHTGALPTGLSLSTTGIIAGVPSATGVFTFTIRATDTYGCSSTFDHTLVVRTLSVGNAVFEDSNNNGVKDAGEPGVTGAVVQLFATGDDNAIGGTGTAADMQAGSDITTPSSGAYLFSGVPPGKYYVKVTPPADYLLTSGTPATADNDIDNNNDGAQPGGSGTALFSPVITLTGGTESTNDSDADTDTNLTIDFGLWSPMAVGNFIFLDINGDGVRNEGESLGDIYVELYAQGSTPGVDAPVSVGSSGCSCKGRYYIEGVNPGTYFLHIPASQFVTGMPLEGLQPMSAVVEGDDDAGQDLVFNNDPAVNGASTAVFTLRPGLCPTGSAESGGEGTIDDDIDARVDLTRDLGVVAPAGSGFAAGERARRYIVTDGFTATVLPGATTFATWAQNSALGGAMDDPDEDGLANLLEYALGTDPFNALQASRFGLTHDNTTGGIAANVTQPITTHDDIVIRLETLADLTQAADSAAWKRVSIATTTTFNGDDTLTRHYSNLEKLLVFKGLDTGFLRLKIELDANRDGIPEATATSSIHAWSRQTFATGARTFSMPLLKPAVFTGRVASVSGHEIVLPYIITLPSGSHYLEVIDGALAGQRFEIDAAVSSGNTLVLQDATQSYAGLADARIVVRPHHTLAELLNPALFGTEDRVLFFDIIANNFTTLANGGDAWIDGVLSMNARPFAAQEAALVQIRGSGAVITFTGEVRANHFVTPLASGTQLIAPGWPASVAAPVTGLRSGPTPETADRLRLWDGDTSPELNSYTSYYLDSTTSPPAWLPQDSVPSSSVIRHSSFQQPFHGLFLIRETPLLLKQQTPW